MVRPKPNEKKYEESRFRPHHTTPPFFSNTVKITAEVLWVISLYVPSILNEHDLAIHSREKSDTCIIIIFEKLYIHILTIYNTNSKH